jgi:hypothetical protein
MGKNYTGLTADTTKHLLLNSGAIFKNWQYGVTDYATAMSTGLCLGATSGGIKFDAKPTLRPIAIDGILGKSKLIANDGWEVKLSTGMIEVTKELIAMTLPGSVSTSGAGDAHTKIVGKNFIVNDDFIENITFVGLESGSNEPVIIQVFNALCTSGLAISTQDKKESVIPVTFEGHYDETDADTPPFAIQYPNVAAAKPTSIVLATGATTPVGGVVNVAIPENKGTDTTGRVTGWVTGTANKVKITVVDVSPAASTITINGTAYVSGTDYTIGAATPLTVVITTTETGMATQTRTFTIAVSA